MKMPPNGVTIKVARKVCLRGTCSARWICRDCGAKCCEHRCGFKTPDGWATCGECQRKKL